MLFRRKGGVEVPALIVPDPSSLVSRRARREPRLPFWFNGQPNLVDQPGRRGAARAARPTSSGKLLQLRPAARGRAAAPVQAEVQEDRQLQLLLRRAPRDERHGQGGRSKSKAIPSGKEDKKARNKEVARKLAQVNRLTTGANLSLTNTIQAGNDRRSGATIYKFFPAVSNIKAGTTLTLQMSPSTTEVHTFTFGPTNGQNLYVDQLAASLIGPVIDPRGAYPSDLPSAGTPLYTGTNHGNGFLNTGFLAGGDPVQLPTSRKVTFTTPGTYNYICLIHPFMTGRVTVTP